MKKRLVDISIIFIAIVVLGLVLKYLQTFLRPFVLAIIITFAVIPSIRHLRKKRIKFWISILGLVIVLFLIISMIGYFLRGEEDIINEKISDPKTQISKRLVDFLPRVNIAGKEIDFSKFIQSERIGNMLASVIATGIQAAGKFFSEMFVIVIFLIFLIPSHDIFLGNIEKSLSRKKKKKFKQVIEKIEKSILIYLKTKFIVSLGTALLSTLILAYFKSDLVFVLGITFFTLNFIPNIGSFIAVGLTLILYLFKFGLGIELVILGVLLTFVQIIFGNIIEPKIAGNKLKLNPIVIILSLFFWYSIWGVIGMIVSVPLTSMVKIVLEEIDSTKNIAKWLS